MVEFYLPMDGILGLNSPICVQQPCTVAYLLQARFTLDDGTVSTQVLSYIATAMIKYGLSRSQFRQLYSMEGTMVDHVSILLMYGGLNVVQLARGTEQARNKFMLGASPQSSTLDSDAALFQRFEDLNNSQKDIICSIVMNGNKHGLPMVHQENGYGWDDVDWSRDQSVELMSLDDQLVEDESLRYFEISESNMICISKSCYQEPSTQH